MDNSFSHLSISDNTENENSKSPPLSPTEASELLANMEFLLADARSDDLTRKLNALTAIRRLVSKEENPPIYEVIDYGWLPIVIHEVEHGQTEKIKFEACWVLTNFASGSSDVTRAIIDAGAIPILLKSLVNSRDDLKEQILWAIGNIAGDHDISFDELMKYHAFELIVQELQGESKLTNSVQHGVWALSNFLRGKRRPPLKIILPVIELFNHFLLSFGKSIAPDILWALSYIVDMSEEHVQAVLDSGIAVRLIECVMDPSSIVKVPALRTIGNICSSIEPHVQMLLDAGLTHCLRPLLESEEMGIRKETCWTISNITAGSSHQIQTIIDAGVIPQITTLAKDDHPSVAKEAMWCLLNGSHNGTSEQIAYFVNTDVFSPLIIGLKNTNSDFVLAVLEAFYNIFSSIVVSVGAENPYCSLFTKQGGLICLKALQSHSDRNISNFAQRIITKFF
eukprot:TRINITY_DN1162_c0_g7_i1.p1 TRINITY_DN1162_c0_g7~~TRINITY_DN1162_c0_g7_i1.p1  ORF type:complete len:499 (-),score=108.00 TRINITY_DN1162_c0_g7_i1:116-1471(-)